MSKVKLLYIITKCSKCGPINVLSSIIDNLDPELFELYLISTSPEDEKRTILDSFKQKFVSYQYVGLSKKAAILGKTKELEKAIEKINPDVIHSTGIVPDLAINRICPEKHMLIVHSNVKIDNVYLCGKVKGTLLAYLNIWLFKKVNCAVACSKSLSEIYKKDGLNLPYIRNGVLVAERKVVNKKELRKQLGLPENKRIFIYTASFNKRKNHLFLVDSFMRVSEDNVLLLLGDGETFEEVKNRISTGNSNIILAGRKYNVMPYLDASDYFVSSSLQEGMPMAVLEAMACGLPVLLSDIDQHKEIFDLCSELGEMFENGSTESFIKGLQQITVHDYAALADNAYETVSKYFNAEIMGKQYQDLYLQLSKK